MPLATETSIFAIPLSFENILEGIKVDPDSLISERIFFNSILLSNSFILEDDFFSNGALPKIILKTNNSSSIKLLRQLKIGGKMILPIGNQKNKIMNLITRISKNKIKKMELGNFLFVPMLKDKI